MKGRWNRRTFLKRAGGTALGASVLSKTWPALAAPQLAGAFFHSVWPATVEGEAYQLPGKMTQQSSV